MARTRALKGYMTISQVRGTCLALVVGIGGVVGCGSGGNDSICNRECAAVAKTRCSGDPPQAVCVADCERTRSALSTCLAEDTAFRECFIVGPISCSTSTAGVTAGVGACGAQSAAYDSCLGKDAGTGPTSCVGNCNCACSGGCLVTGLLGGACTCAEACRRSGCGTSGSGTCH